MDLLFIDQNKPLQNKMLNNPPAPLTNKAPLSDRDISIITLIQVDKLTIYLVLQRFVLIYWDTVDADAFPHSTGKHVDGAVICCARANIVEGITVIM